MRALAASASWLIRSYQQLLSPILPPTCRFFPSCSEYARLTLLSHGLPRAIWPVVRRIGRCHPFHPGGFDPPPVLHGGSTAEDLSAKWKNERFWQRF